MTSKSHYGMWDWANDHPAAAFWVVLVLAWMVVAVAQAIFT